MLTQLLDSKLNHLFRLWRGRHICRDIKYFLCAECQAFLHHLEKEHTPRIKLFGKGMGKRHHKAHTTVNDSHFWTETHFNLKSITVWAMESSFCIQTLNLHPAKSYLYLTVCLNDLLWDRIKIHWEKTPIFFRRNLLEQGLCFTLSSSLFPIITGKEFIFHNSFAMLSVWMCLAVICSFSYLLK